MSTRKRSNISNANAVPKSDLPAPRKGKAIATQKTTPPFSRMPFNTFVYILSALAFVFVAFQVWRIIQLKTTVGGWWNLALGQRPVSGENGAHSAYDAAKGKGKSHAESRERDSVEDRINALAEALGIPSHDLASAIAEAVKSHVPPASLSSVAAAEATKSGTAAGILVGKEEAPQPGTGIADKLGAMSGFDDPIGME